MTEHIVPFKMRIMNSKKSKCKLNLWVCLNLLPNSVVSTVQLNLKPDGLISQTHSKLALQLNKRTQII